MRYQDILDLQVALHDWALSVGFNPDDHELDQAVNGVINALHGYHIERKPEAGPRVIDVPKADYRWPEAGPDQGAG